MNEDEEEFEYDEDEWVMEPPRRRFMPTDVVVLGLHLVAGISGAVTNTLNTAQALAAAHANFKVAQHEFHEEAALEIETMTGESDG